MEITFAQGAENKKQLSAQVHIEHLFIPRLLLSRKGEKDRRARVQRKKKKGCKILSAGHRITFAAMIFPQLHLSVLGLYKIGPVNSQSQSWRGSWVATHPLVSIEYWALLVPVDSSKLLVITKAFIKIRGAHTQKTQMWKGNY